jgi:integrase
VSVHKRPNGKWRARYRDPSGKERARHFDRKIDAEDWVRDQQVDVSRGQWVDYRAGRMKVGEYVEQWLAAQVQHRIGTTRMTTSRLNSHILPFFKDRPLAAVSRSEVQAWVANRAQVLAPSTLEVVYRLLSQVFAAAVEDRRIAVSPCRKIQLTEKVKTEVVPLSTEQVAAIAEALPERLQAVVWLGAQTGMRLGEVLGLTVDRIDFLRRTIRVDRQLQPNADGHLALSPPKTKASVRTIPIGKVTVEVLAAHLKRWPSNELVFTQNNGAPIRANRWNQIWREACGEEKTKFHDLRHTYASVLIAAGASVKVVQARLGHASAMETLDTYGHMWPDDEDRTRKAVDKAYGPRTVRGTADHTSI